MNTVKIYTDGACSGNPGPGGWGAILQFPDRELEISGGELQTTNNRMELMAAISALEAVPIGYKVELFTDSKYVQNGITIWIKNWIKNNWRTADKKPVKNQELWLRLLQLVAKYQVTWCWVEGHSGHELNERADRLARSQCKK